MAEHHQPAAMPADEMWRLLARFQRRTQELLDVIAASEAGQ